MKKLVLAGVLGGGVLAASVLVYAGYLAKPNPKPVLEKQAVLKIEAQLDRHFRSSLQYFRPPKDWVKVKNCKITYRLHPRNSCAQSHQSRYTEYQIDLTEVERVEYTESRDSITGNKGSLSFTFIGPVSLQFRLAEAYFWKTYRERKGLYDDLWQAHVEVAEQAVIKQFALDKFGSYSISEGCLSKKRLRHLPYTLNTLVLSEANRSAARALTQYHKNCTNG